MSKKLTAILLDDSSFKKLANLLDRAKSVIRVQEQGKLDMKEIETEVKAELKLKPAEFKELLKFEMTPDNKLTEEIEKLNIFHEVIEKLQD